MDNFEIEIKNDFINEALINLEEVEGCFMELESAEDKKPLLDKIFRMAHNLKGGSRAVGFGDVAEFTHNLENLVLKIQKNEVVLSSEIVTTLLRCNDRLVEMLTVLKQNIHSTFKNDDLIEDIKAWIEGRNVPTANNNEAAPAELEIKVDQPAVVTSDELVSYPNEDLNLEASLEPESIVPPSADSFFEPQEIPTVPLSVAPSQVIPSIVENKNTTEDKSPIQTKKVEKASEKEDEIIRVSLSKIDMLNDYVGELIVLQSVIQQQVQTSSAQSVQIGNSVQQMIKLSKDIQNISMSLRMLPVKPLVQKLQRVVRDTAKALDKDVNFEVVGEGMDIDKSVLDKLADPLIHILRNAVDHGLETNENRIRAEKKPKGNLKLSFSNEGNHLIVEIKDDGKGIDSQIIKAKAIEKGLISSNQILTEKQIINLVFHPGFSTKAVTSEISGRGVGMDVVKTNIEKIGGNVDIQTLVGNGTTFKLQIPLTLAVIDGLVINASKNRFVVPLSQIQETINLKAQKVHANKLGIGSCFDLRGEVVPLFSIDELLNNQTNPQKFENETCLIVNVNDSLVGVVVKEIVRSQQIVIKQFAGGIAPQKGWIGSCVLGDGLPTLIVSPVDLLSGKVIKHFFSQNMEKAA